MTTTPKPKAPTAASGGEAAGFRVTPAELAGAAGTFDAQASALGEALQELQSHLGSLGACWGDDEEGEKFGASYQKGAQQMLADLADLQSGLDKVAGALGASASAYEQADAASTPALDPTSTAAPTGTSTPAPVPAPASAPAPTSTPAPVQAPASTSTPTGISAPAPNLDGPVPTLAT